MSGEDSLIFEAEPDPDPTQSAVPWKILVADDDEEIHSVTALALRDFRFYSRPLQVLHAYSGRQAVDIARQHPDLAMVLMDVVMESDHAGLEAVRRIREDLGNRFVRIVIRTGQPGQAPEKEVVTHYDINDYKEKTELTEDKLFTVVHTGLGYYRELRAIDEQRSGLRTIIDASIGLLDLQTLNQLIKGVMQQLAGLLYGNSQAALLHASGAAASKSRDGTFKVIVGTGHYAGLAGSDLEVVLPEAARKCIAQAIETKTSVSAGGHFAVCLSSHVGSEAVVYFSSDDPIPHADQLLIELFCNNASRAYDNLAINQSVKTAQRDLVLMLSETVEERSPETLNHIRRVSAYGRLMGELLGKSEDECTLIEVAIATHDVGKIAIPEAILNKPAELAPDEWEIMKTHAARGATMLSKMEGEIISAAAIIAGQHHEKWDGSGYPGGLAGEGIHLYGRIAALIDVFDALSHERCYKPAWPMDRVVEFIRKERGRHFEPRLVDVLLANLDQFVAIGRRFTDNKQVPVSSDTA